MTSGMRRIAALVSALTLAVSLVFAGALYAVGTNTAATHVMGSRTAPATSHEPPDGVETISDDDVPLAATPGQAPKKTTPVTTFALVGALVVAGAYYVVRIRRVDANIAQMRNKVH